ncbi:MAG TPA: glycosyltransferase [Candidatus Limnocylindrales bacterium]|nr:glycosyltransferase [Candidatus Limnocylindrales bacterium]
MKPIRVALLSSYDDRGGAARAALRLHRALPGAGVESRLLVQRRFGSEPGVDGPRGGLRGAIAAWRPRLDSIPVRFYGGRAPQLFSPSWLPDGTSRRIESAAPDVVHLHWVGFGFVRPETLARLRAPIVWTLHDSWAFTGGCHLPGSCTRYRGECGACPALGSRRDRDLSRWVFARKRRAWRALAPRLVAPSRWIADAARSSALFRDVPVEVVPNGVDLDRFRPRDRDEARERLDLPRDRSVLLFSGLEGLGDPNKGFDLLEEALAVLAGRGVADRFLLLVVGSDAPRGWAAAPIPVRFAGRIDDEERLALHLAAADLVVLPSRSENQPNLVTEAMACARPAVAFRTSGLPDLVVDRETGYLAEPYRAEDLADGIVWVTQDPARLRRLGDAARDRAELEYGHRRAALRYRDLYEAAVRGARAAD